MRFKSYALWVAVAALGGLIIQDLGVDFTPAKYQTYVDTILTILVLAGIINSPKDGKGFK